MKLVRVLLAVPTAVLLLAFPQSAWADESVEVSLTDVNGTGAGGTATFTATANGDLTVVIRSTGLTPNAPHAQHLHASFMGGMFHCPDRASDADGDGVVSTEEGLPGYGDIAISLTTTGDTSKASGLALDRMPKADSQGVLTYQRTIPAAELPEGTAQHLADLHVVQHGIDSNDNGRYDMQARGESTFATSLGVKGIPAEATDPATCGMVEGVAAAVVPDGGVATGDGSTDPRPTLLYGLGATALLGAFGAVLARRRLPASR